MFGAPIDETMTNTEAREYLHKRDRAIRLRRAAPDLLAELEMIVQGWQDVASTVRPLTPWEQERMRFAQEAIAQAKGEKPEDSP